MNELLDENGKKLQDFPYSKTYHIVSEVLNSLTHGLSFLVAIAGMVILIYKAVMDNQGALEIFSYILYGITTCFLFLFSTLYHSLSFTKAKSFMRKLDHSAIFLIIAGTYTPFCLASLKGKTGIFIFAIEWVIAILGITMKFVSFNKVKKFSTLLYLAMGWMIIFSFRPMYRCIGKYGMLFLFLGGVSYTIGTIFYSMKNIRFMHTIWHLFVTMGSIFMWISIYLYVA